MATVDESKINEFTIQMCSLLDSLWLFPMSLMGREATPTRLEKYPRLLFGYFRRYDQVEMAFKEWESKILRDVENSYIKQKNFPELAKLQKWCVENHALFDGENKKINLQHLRGSLYARVYTYLYAKRLINRAVTNELTDKLRSAEMVDDKTLINNIKEWIEDDGKFQSMISSLEQTELKEVKEIFSEEWDKKVQDAREHFISSIPYYLKIIKGEHESKVPTEIPLEERTENV